jgi:hypothetical protein
MVRTEDSGEEEKSDAFLCWEALIYHFGKREKE